MLRDVIDDELTRLIHEPGTADDPMAADRRVRRATNIARAIKAVEALNTADRPLAADAEQEMNEADDDDPVERAELQAELLARYARLRAVYDARDAMAGGEVQDVADGDGPDAGAGSASGAGPEGLAHLVDAGWAGSGQDLRGGLVAA